MRMTSRTLLAACASLLLLSACGSTTTAPAPEAPIAEAPQRADTCGAAEYASLIGSNVAAVTFPAGANIRIIQPGQPVTDDMRPDRLNVIADANGIITSLECY